MIIHVMSLFLEYEKKTKIKKSKSKGTKSFAVPKLNPRALARVLS